MCISPLQSLKCVAIPLVLRAVVLQTGMYVYIIYVCRICNKYCCVQVVWAVLVVFGVLASVCTYVHMVGVLNCLNK